MFSRIFGIGWVVPSIALLAPLATPAGLQEPEASQAGEPRDLSSLLGAVRKTYKIPGLACAIVSSEGVVLARGVVGVRKKGDETPMEAGDVFHLGSCTKAMTATLVAMAVEEEKLTWDTSVGTFWAEEVSDAATTWNDATLEQLLQHRSGAPEHLEIKGLWWRLKNHEGTPVEARLDLVEGVLPQEPRSKPGTAYLYSNAGYAIAGAMLEKVMEKSWEELMRERLFDPLGMESAGFGPPGRAGSLDQPWGHKPDGYAVDPGAPFADNPPAIGPAGTVHATLEDWGRFVALHMAALRDEPRLLSAETYERLFAVPEGREYAMGWFNVRRGWAGGQALNHAGSNTQWYCVVWAAPARDFAVLVACNIGGRQAQRACDDVIPKLVQDQLTSMGIGR